MRASFDGVGDVVVVTGGASGISRAVAEAAHDVGCSVWVLDVATAPDLPEGISQLRVDVSDRDAVLAAAETVIHREGRVDGLICGAAIQPRAPALETDPSTWRQVTAVNLDGVVWACQAFVPHMVRQRSGSVVVFTSGIALSGYPNASAYSATKAALHGYARSLAAEVADARVRVNVVAPGVVDTPQMRAANEGGDRAHWAQTTGIGEPEDVVGPLLFLLSEDATMTGSVLTRERVFRRNP